MTKRERSAVVELLRCAADNLSPTSIGAWTDAIVGLDITLEVEIYATGAYMKVRADRGSPRNCEFGRSLYLEAAQRVESGEWP